MASGSPAGAIEWFRLARRHLRISKGNLEIGYADAAAFYAQQAVEFALKALQIQRTGRFTKTHDLSQLAKSVSAPPRVVKLAALVAPVYVGARYPDVGGPRINRSRAEVTLDAARRIVRWVRRQLV